MNYLIKRRDFMNYLKERDDLSAEEKAGEFDDFCSLVLCPYKGHKIDLREVRRNLCNIGSGEYKCPKCDEWILWDIKLPWFQQAPYPINSFIINHKKEYQCIVNPKFENSKFNPSIENMLIWYDKNLNPIRPNTIPLNSGEIAVPLNEKIYVAIRK